MKRQYSEEYEPEAKKAKVLDFFGRTVESMDIDPDVAWLLLAKNIQTDRRPTLKAARGQAQRRCNYPNNPVLTLKTCVMKRAASSFNSRNYTGSKKNKTGPIVKMMDVNNELAGIFNKLHL